jgi:hypothetical protein
MNPNGTPQHQIESDLQRTQPRPRRAFEQTLEAKLVEQFKQPVQGDSTMMTSTLAPTTHLPYSVPSRRWISSLAAVLLVALLGAGIFIFHQPPPPQATSVAISMVTATSPVLPIPATPAPVEPTPTLMDVRVTITPDTLEAEVSIPLTRFALWGLPNFVTLPTNTPVQLWTTQADTGNLVSVSYRARYIRREMGSEGESPVSKLVFALDWVEANEIDHLLREDTRRALLIAIPDPLRTAPPYTLTDSQGDWRTAPGQAVVVIPLERVNFSSTDVYPGDLVTLYALRGANNETLETVDADARVLDIDERPDSLNMDYVVLLVDTPADTVQSLLAEPIEFAILEEPNSTRQPVSAYPLDTVMYPMGTSQAMTSCAVVDVIGVFLNIGEPDASGVYPPASVDLQTLAQRVRLLTAPLTESGFWTLQFETQDEEVVSRNFVISGGRLFLQPACR